MVHPPTFERQEIAVINQVPSISSNHLRRNPDGTMNLPQPPPRDANLYYLDQATHYIGDLQSEPQTFKNKAQ